MSTTPAQTNYDILIIGAGLAGLQCGVILSRNGYKVLVLEKNNHIGGTLQSFDFKGIRFTTGLHYMGSLDEGQVLNRLFRYFNLLDGITYKRLDEHGFDVFNIGGKKFALPMGWKAYSAFLIEQFPEEESSVRQYVSAIESTVNEQEIFNLHEPVNYYQEKPSQSVNAWEFICSLTENPELRQVLSALNFVYAGDKNATPWYVHALINHYFISSSYRIVGSSSQIPERLKLEIEKTGGQVLTRQKVTKLLFDEDRLSGVLCEDGSTFFGEKLISNIHPAATMNLIENGKIRKSFRNRLEQKTDTLSAFAIYLKLEPGKFRYQNNNYNFYLHPDVWYASGYDASRWPEHYFIHFPADEPNPKWVNHLSIVTHMSFEEVAEWKHLSSNARGADYKQFKREKADKLLKLVFLEFPELEYLITDYTTATPLTFRDYVGSPTGSMYGTLRDYKFPMASYVGVRTKIPNLYFTGQNLNLHGVMGVSMSALLTCAEFVNLPDL
ncbi:MAG: NAD(P)/FAD-dependent oxidoreductase, partial [Bacteroidales bacterium]